MAGQPEPAIEHVEHSMRLSPRETQGVPTLVIGIGHLLCRRFEEAATNFTLAVRQVPDWPISYRHLAACYAHLGRLDEARSVIEQLRTTGAPIMPGESGLTPEAHELVISGLRLAIGERA
jgi:pentatricopeptide repeat protein